MSDQDFFFDEEDEAQAKPSGTAKSSGSAKGTSPKSSAAPKRTAPASVGFFDRGTTMAVASLVGVIGLLLGVITGFLLNGVLAGSATTVPAPAAGVPGTGSGTTGGGTPGALSPDQLQGGMPANHPAVPGQTTGESTATK